MVVDEATPLIHAEAAAADPDIFYLHEARREKD